MAYTDRILSFATDNEPLAGGKSPALIQLCENADLACMDSQFTRKEYIGEDGPSRQLWGHGFPEYCAVVANDAGVKDLRLIHHDPDSSDEKIKEIEKMAQKIFPNCRAAYEGLEVEI